MQFPCFSTGGSCQTLKVSLGVRLEPGRAKVCQLGGSLGWNFQGGFLKDRSRFWGSSCHQFAFLSRPFQAQARPQMWLPVADMNLAVFSLVGFRGNLAVFSMFFPGGSTANGRLYRALCHPVMFGRIRDVVVFSPPHHPFCYHKFRHARGWERAPICKPKMSGSSISLGEAERYLQRRAHKCRHHIPTVDKLEGK